MGVPLILRAVFTDTWSNCSGIGKVYVSTSNTDSAVVRNAPVAMQIKVVGPADLTGPAGTFHTTELSYDVTVETEGGMITIRQTRWFAPGVGYVKQDTETRLGDHMLTHVVLTLEKYEPARGA